MSTSGCVRVAGVGMVPFRRPGSSERYDLMAERAVRAALDDARLDYELLDQGFASFVHGDTLSGERALYRSGMTGIPITNVNNGCASGSSALHLARQAILAGEAECAIAVGFDEMPCGARGRLFPDHADPLERHLQCVATTAALGPEDLQAAPDLRLFAAQLDWVAREWGVSERALASVVVKARAHARHNPYALSRDPLTLEEVLSAPTTLRRFRAHYASPPASGAAAVILCTRRFAERHRLRDDVAVLAHVMASDIASDLDPPNVPDALGRAGARRAARAACERAGVGPEDIDVAEVHDCSVSNELIACAALGFCEEGDVEGFALSGANTHGGRVVVGPSGGMLSMGHPPGATGLAQVCELVWHLRGEAGSRQVAGARTALQHNGGPGGAVSVAILQRTR